MPESENQQENIEMSREAYEKMLGDLKFKWKIIEDNRKNTALDQRAAKALVKKIDVLLAKKNQRPADGLKELANFPLTKDAADSEALGFGAFRREWGYVEPSKEEKAELRARNQAVIENMSGASVVREDPSVDPIARSREYADYNNKLLAFRNKCSEMKEQGVQAAGPLVERIDLLLKFPAQLSIQDLTDIEGQVEKLRQKILVREWEEDKDEEEEELALDPDNAYKKLLHDADKGSKLGDTMGYDKQRVLKSLLYEEVFIQRMVDFTHNLCRYVLAHPHAADDANHTVSQLLKAADAALQNRDTSPCERLEKLLAVAKKLNAEKDGDLEFIISDLETKLAYVTKEEREILRQPENWERSVRKNKEIRNDIAAAPKLVVEKHLQEKGAQQSENKTGLIKKLQNWISDVLGISHKKMIQEVVKTAVALKSDRTEGSHFTFFKRKADHSYFVKKFTDATATKGQDLSQGNSSINAQGQPPVYVDENNHSQSFRPNPGSGSDSE